MSIRAAAVAPLVPKSDALDLVDAMKELVGRIYDIAGTLDCVSGALNECDVAGNTSPVACTVSLATREANAIAESLDNLANKVQRAAA